MASTVVSLGGESGSSEVMEGIRLHASDIPGAELSQPFEKHPLAALRWWLLCRGIKVSNSLRKKDVIDK